MTFDEQSRQRGESRSRSRESTGWTSIHSWVFLGIIAVGLLLLVMQNRYHYLNPQGLGKAYRIDKIFGSIQEFDPADGWIVARLAQAPPGQMAGMAPPPSVGSPAMPMHVPAPPSPDVRPPSVPPLAEKPSGSAPPERTEQPGPPQPTAKSAVKGSAPAETADMSPEQRLQAFLKAFPDYGQEEFQLANDDLFPDWKRSVAPQGTWPEFLKVYGGFIDWWQKAGAPAESGIKLWKDYMVSQKRK